MAESLLALSALALAGDDLHEAVERLAREASKQRDPGHALGMIQVAVDLGRRYLPADDPLPFFVGIEPVPLWIYGLRDSACTGKIGVLGRGHGDRGELARRSRDFLICGL
jgi:hypothetical protein